MASDEVSWGIMELLTALPADAEGMLCSEIIAGLGRISDPGAMTAHIRALYDLQARGLVQHGRQVVMVVQANCRDRRPAWLWTATEAGRATVAAPEGDVPSWESVAARRHQAGETITALSRSLGKDLRSVKQGIESQGVEVRLHARPRPD